MSIALYRCIRAAGILVVVLGLAGCDIAVDGHGGFDFGMAAGKATDQWTRSYNLASGGRLEIINVNGQITAEASDGSSVEISAERTAKAATDEAAKELLGKIEMREEVGGDRVRVEVRAPRMSGPSGHEIKWTVKVPRGVAVDLRTINGGVKMIGLEGDVRARSTNGGITGVALVTDVGRRGGDQRRRRDRARQGDRRGQRRSRGGQRRREHHAAGRTARRTSRGRCVNGGISTEPGLRSRPSASRRTTPRSTPSSTAAVHASRSKPSTAASRSCGRAPNQGT